VPLDPAYNAGLAGHVFGQLLVPGGEVLCRMVLTARSRRILYLRIWFYLYRNEPFCDILQTMREETLKIIAEKFRIRLIYLFGSQADAGRTFLEGGKIEPGPFSDLDVAVSFEKPPAATMKVYGNLYREISELFDPFNVDLLFMHEVNSLFQYEVIRGVRIYERDGLIADEFEERVMKIAEDLIFKKRIFDQEVMEAMEHGYFEFKYVPNP
jgi:predicted nucleotidyltransferase